MRDLFLEGFVSWEVNYLRALFLERFVSWEVNYLILYPINGYISEYFSKIFNKSKGSGLGMYIREDIQHTRMEQFCSCTPNLEYMFIEICNSDNKKPKCVGVVYRPPSGSENLAL